MYLFLGGKGSVVAISPDDGREVWRTTLVEKKFFTVSGIDYRVTVLDQGSQVFALNSTLSDRLPHLAPPRERPALPAQGLDFEYLAT